jgi:hypothetical protein
VLAKVVDAAIGIRECTKRTVRSFDFGQPVLEALKLRTQDQRVGSARFRELPQLRLGDEPLRIPEHCPNPFLQSGVELEPGFGHRGPGD